MMPFVLVVALGISLALLLMLLEGLVFLAVVLKYAEHLYKVALNWMFRWSLHLRLRQPGLACGGLALVCAFVIYDLFLSAQHQVSDLLVDACQCIPAA